MRILLTVNITTAVLLLITTNHAHALSGCCTYLTGEEAIGARAGAESRLHLLSKCEDLNKPDGDYIFEKSGKIWWDVTCRIENFEDGNFEDGKGEAGGLLPDDEMGGCSVGRGSPSAALLVLLLFGGLARLGSTRRMRR